MAKTVAICNRFSVNLKEAATKKVYLARVGGEVKETKFSINRKIKCLSKKLSKYDTCDDSDIDGKESLTEFELIFYDNKTNTSLIKCELTRLSEDR